MSTKTVTLNGVEVQASLNTSINDVLFQPDWAQEHIHERPPTLGGSLADITKNLSIARSTMSCFFKTFREGKAPLSSWLPAVMAAFQFPVNERFSLGVWSSADPLNDGCLKLLRLMPSKTERHAIDVIDLIEAFIAQENTTYQSDRNDFEEYIAALYCGAQRTEYTSVMRFVDLPGFDNGTLLFSYAFFLCEGTDGPCLWVWSRPLFFHK
jgi:hypothetical protein